MVDYYTFLAPGISNKLMDIFSVALQGIGYRLFICRKYNYE